MSGTLDSEELERFMLYPVKCSRCMAQLTLLRTERVCPICADYPLVSREQRKYPRARIKLPLVLDLAQGRVLGETKDISAGGAFISTPKRFRANNNLSMAIINSPPLERTLPVRAKIVRSNIYCLDDETMFHGMSVVFIRISGQDRILIADLVLEQLKGVADIALARRTERNKRIFESFADFVLETTGRTDLDKVRKGQMIHEGASSLRLKFIS